MIKRWAVCGVLGKLCKQLLRNIKKYYRSINFCKNRLRDFLSVLTRGYDNFCHGLQVLSDGALQKVARGFGLLFFVKMER